MVHEDGERDVVRQDDLCASARRDAPSRAKASARNAKASPAKASRAARGCGSTTARRVGRRRVELGQQEPRLGPVLVAVDEARDREALAGKGLGVAAWRGEQGGEGGVLGRVLVAGAPPGRDGCLFC